MNEPRVEVCPRDAAGVEYLIERVMPAARQYSPVPLRVVLEDALREMHPGIPVYLRDVIPPHAEPRGFAADVPGSTWILHVGQPALTDPQRAFLRSATAFAAIVAELDRRPAGQPRQPRRAIESALIGASPAIERVRERIARVAETDFTVLVEGESGVGKELVARQVHEQSRRRRGPFVAINCAALVETLVEAELFGIEDRTATGVRGRRGKFEQAEGGTLFLDEVSDLSASAQAKLLRAIQDLAIERVGGHISRSIDTRIIVATNRGLSALVAQREFRADLYYRLNGVEVIVPPLRARRADIPILVEHFLERFRTLRRVRISRSAMELLQACEWPGNVRQLERVVERAVTLASGPVIEPGDLPVAVTGDFAGLAVDAAVRNDTMRAWGSRYARIVLDRCHGNKRQACRMLGISYHTLEGHLRWSGERRRRERIAANIGHAPLE
ncbi:MAG TPA: sigma-54 dependent transcriptional regulator [Vicinamibacterales bacterium]|nr:sigma-54 dependent transcriptional regulator [Vicinamibacterales bacterium]